MQVDVQMTILIADDSATARLYVKNQLPKKFLEHSNVIEATNGKEAVELYKEHKPDVVFLDITMPVMNGLDALENIIAFDHNAVVYILTADRQESTAQYALELGAKEMLYKPIDMKTVDRLLYSVMFGETL